MKPHRSYKDERNVLTRHSECYETNHQNPAPSDQISLRSRVRTIRKKQEQLTAAHAFRRGPRVPGQSDRISLSHKLGEGNGRSVNNATPSSSSSIVRERNAQPTVSKQQDDVPEKNYQGGLPLPSNATPATTSKVWGWGHQIVNLAASTMSYLSLNKKQPPNEGSASVTKDDGSDWVEVEHSEVGNGKYEQFVEQQDLQEYEMIDGREADSCDEDGDEDEGLGGERWDRVLC